MVMSSDCCMQWHTRHHDYLVLFIVLSLCNVLLMLSFMYTFCCLIITNIKFDLEQSYEVQCVQVR